jgi:hypothetical protein
MSLASPGAAERGNVFWYIMVAIALFAALSYAVSQSNRGSVAAMSEEQARLAATEILDYASALSTATAQLRLRGFKDTEVSYENPVVAGYANPVCTDGACRIFSPEGGGVAYKAPVTEWLDSSHAADPGYGAWIFSGDNEVDRIGTDGATAANKELIAFLPYVKKALCLELNRKTGVTNPSDMPPREADQIAAYTALFGGTYVHGESLTLPDPDKGKNAGCFEGGGNPSLGTYHFYQVLMAR